MSSSSSDSDVAPVRTSRKRVKNEEEWKATVRKRKRVSGEANSCYLILIIIVMSYFHVIYHVFMCFYDY